MSVKNYGIILNVETQGLSWFEDNVTQADLSGLFKHMCSIIHGVV